MHTGCQRLFLEAGVVAGEAQRFALPEQQIEAGVALGPGRELPQIVGDADFGGQEVGDELAPRWCIGVRRHHATDIGHGRQPPGGGVDRQPTTAAAEVASAEDIRSLWPGRGGGCRAGVELVAVGGHHQRHVGAGLPGDGDKAHGRLAAE